MSDPDKVEAATLKRIASGTVEGLSVRSVFETEKNLLLETEKNLNKVILLVSLMLSGYAHACSKLIVIVHVWMTLDDTAT